MAELSQPIGVTIIHEFPRGTWLENIEQRASGQILTTSLTAPSIWQLDPTKPVNQTPELIVSIPSKTCTLGITEIRPDIFVFVAGGFDMSTGTLNGGSSSIYSLNMTQSPASAEKIADFSEAQLLNGITLLPSSAAYPQGLLLAADSILGSIWSLDLATKTIESWSRDPLMAPNPSGGIGINGVKFDHRSHTLYFSNTRVQGGYLASLPVDPTTYKPAGAGSIVGGIAQGIAIDDFDLDLEHRRAFVAAGTQNQVDAVDLETGQVTVLAGMTNSTEVAVPTAVKIGRTARDKERGVIYVSTTGGFPGGVDGVVIGGQILSVCTKHR